MKDSLDIQFTTSSRSSLNTVPLYLQVCDIHVVLRSDFSFFKRDIEYLSGSQQLKELNLK